MSFTDSVDGRNVGLAALAGVAAYAFGYLVTYVTQRDRVAQRLERYNFVLELLGEDTIPTTDAVGWLFYNAHFVDTVFPTFGGTSRYVNFVAESDGGSLTMLYLVPPLLLLLAAVATATVAGASDPADGAGVGVLLVAGYLPAAIAGLVLFAYAGGDEAVRPDVVTGVLLAGVAYPLVFGLVGGGVAGFVSPRS